MKNSEHIINDWALRVFAIEKARGLHTSNETLSQVYEILTDEQKIAFILAGGVPSLFHCQQYHTQHMRTSSDTQTGQLPVLC